MPISFDGEPGPCNNITDVTGVAVGYHTLNRGSGPMKVGEGPVRTGVTAILPRPREDLLVPVFSGFYSMNGNGDMTGTHIIEETGEMFLPITLTNTSSCGTARDGTLAWAYRAFPDRLDDIWALPVAAETYDGFLNDINGGHIHADHVAAAIETAAAGPCDEGSVGGGTGMVCFEFKAGSGTSSRRVEFGGTAYTIGVFVQANFGKRRNFMIRGRRLGAELAEPRIRENRPNREKGSIIGIIATDAPLLPHQLKRLARRAPLGVAWTGGLAYHSSGDIFLAFSTANGGALGAGGETIRHADFIPDAALDPFFDAVANGIEEAILNSLVANQDMTGRDDNFVPALPHDAVRRLHAEPG